MKNKRISCLLAICIMATTLGLTGCGEKETKQDTELDEKTVNETETENTSVEESETEEENETVQIIMVGDMLMHDRVYESGEQDDGTYNFDHLFTNVTDFVQSVDLALVNQETIIGGTELGLSGYPCFNSPYELADAELKAGFDVLLQATNHAMDKGKTGILNDINYLRDSVPELTYLGIHDTKESYDSVYICEVNGIKIAILNYTYGTNGIPLPEDMPYAVSMLEEEKVLADIKYAEEMADFTIVCPHWGTEYVLETDYMQAQWTQLFLENGVDLVIGAHPHVIEPIEWVEDEDGHKMLVYYSLGNFVNGTSSEGHGVTTRMVGGMADVTIGRLEDGSVAIIDDDIHPLICHIDENESYTTYFIEDYNEALASENLILRQDDSFSLEQCQDIVDTVWGDYFEQKK